MTEGYDRLRTVITDAIAACPDGEEAQLRQRIQQFAAGLEPDDLAILERVVVDLDAERIRADETYEAEQAPWRQNPALMAHHLEGDRYQLYPYIAYLGQKFRQLETGEDPFQIWELPPQLGKSNLAQRGIAWALDRNPSGRYITTSYGDELADRNGLAVRDYLIEHGEHLRVRLRRDAKRLDRFQTDAGGGLLAAGLFAGMTGFTADAGIVIDDPYKGWEEAHSAAYRKRVSNTIKTVVFMRRSHGNVWVLVITTRWHEEDIANELGHQVGNELGVNFTVTRLPEIAEAPDPVATDPILRLPDPLGREPGELLCPDRFDAAAVAIKHNFLGPYLSAGLLQQRPAPAAGTEIMRDWFKFGDLPPKCDRAITSWDMKLKDKESGDYVVGQCWWKVGGTYWLVDSLRGQWNQATTEAAMALMHIRHPEAKFHYYENTGNGPEVATSLTASDKDFTLRPEVVAALGMTLDEATAVENVLRRGMESLIPVTPKGDKSVRMRAQSPRIAGGNVWLPTGATWSPAYLDEMASFGGGGAHDDQVDATSQALKALTGAAATVSSATPGRVPTKAPRTPGAAAGRIAVRGGGSTRRGR